MFNEDFRGSFGEDIVFVVSRLLIDDGHSLSIRAEWNCSHNVLLSLSDLLEVMAQLITKLKKSALSFVTNLFENSSFDDWLGI